MGGMLNGRQCSLTAQARRYTRRIIVVRRDAADVYEQLQKAYADDSETVIIYDRRSGSEADDVAALRELTRERRRFHESDILKVRGFYNIRLRPSGDDSLTRDCTRWAGD